MYCIRDINPGPIAGYQHSLVAMQVFYHDICRSGLTGCLKSLQNQIAAYRHNLVLEQFEAASQPFSAHVMVIHLHCCINVNCESLSAVAPAAFCLYPMQSVPTAGPSMHMLEAYDGSGLMSNLSIPPGHVE